MYKRQLQDLYDIAVKFAATIGDGINPAGTRALEAAYADLITLLLSLIHI